MKSFRLLHITDLHFGIKDKSDLDSSVNHKDPAVNKTFVDKISSHWTEDFFNSIENWQRINNKIDAVVCSGDLGNAGKSETIETGVIFLNNLFNKLSLDKSKLIICPGNHDLERDKQGTEFEYFEKYLKAEGYFNYSSYENIKTVLVKNIPIIAINSCIGGTETSLFVEKYKLLVKKLNKKEVKKIKQELSDIQQSYLDDFLDIPSIGKKQISDLIDVVGSSNSDSAVIIMHHNPFPNSSIELRPYSHLIDGGRAITSLLNTEKKVFILHGHTHFEYNITANYPSQNGSYISSLGCGCLNHKIGAKANIIEFYFSKNDNHLITKLYTLSRNGAGYESKFNCSVFDKELSPKQTEIKLFEFLSNNPSLLFSDLSSLLGNPNDEDLLKLVLINEERFIKIDKNKSDEFDKWIISKIK